MGKAIGKLHNERVPKVGFNAEYIRNILCQGDFQHMKDGQQCVFEFFQIINQTLNNGDKVWPDIANLFSFKTKEMITCATCGISRETDIKDSNYMDIYLPQNCKRNMVELNVFTKLVESYFGHPVYNQERGGCFDHPQSGAMITEVLEYSPECFVLNNNSLVLLYMALVFSNMRFHVVLGLCN